MKKFNFSKKVLGLAASALGTVAIVGAGFSAWYFTGDLTNGLSNGDKKGNVIVTVAYEDGEVALTDSDYEVATYYLVLDQGGIIDTSDGNYGNVGLALLALENTDSFDGDATYGNSTITDAIKSIDNICALWTLEENMFNELTENYDLSVSVTVTLNEALAGYVTIYDASDGSTTDTYTTTMAAGSLSYNNGGVELSIATPTFKWVENKKPTTFDEYATMVKALDSEITEVTSQNYTISDLLTITFTVTASTKTNG